MADNVTILDSVGATRTIAADDIGGVLSQRFKLQLGTDGNAVDVANHDEVTLLASAARSATTNSPVQTNYDCRGVVLILNVTAASGSGGLTVRLCYSSSFGTIIGPQAAAAVTATGKQAYLFYPGCQDASSLGAGSILVSSFRVALPQLWLAQVQHGDGTSYTYQLDAFTII